MSSDDSSSSESSVYENKKIKKVPIFDPVLKVKPKLKQIVINLSMTKYDVISDVADELDWRIQYSRKKNDWDIFWTDYMIQPQNLIRMHFFQKISHFPGIYVVARKNLLGLSCMQMNKKFPDKYNFFPRTWMLPNDYPELRQDVEKNENKCYIVKPEAGCQGKGIFLTFKTQDVENGRHYVVQEYLEKPFLVEGLKFDCRVYVLLCGTNPMRLFVYGEGLARFATEKYEEPSKNNIKKQFMHLTNYAVNKKNPKYIYNSSAKNMSYGHKRSLTSVFKYIERRGLNVKVLKEKMNDVIIKTMILSQPLVSHQYKFCQPDDQYRQMCFHILGIDIMIDECLNPYIIEVNHTPSFATDTPLDYHIKFNLIKDTLQLLNINEEMKKKLVKKTNSYERQRVTNGKRLAETQEQRAKVKEAQQQRQEYEIQNLGNYTKIFPIEDQNLMNEYNEYLKAAEKSYFSENNVVRAQIQEAQQEKKKSKSKISPRKIQSGQNESPLKNTSYEKQVKNIMENSCQTFRKQLRMSSLLQNNHSFVPFPSYHSRQEQQHAFGNPHYIKIAKSIGEFETDPMTNIMPPKRLVLAKNLPRIQARTQIKASTIEIQKNKYVSWSKKKSLDFKNKQKEEKVKAVSERKDSGSFLTPKVIRFQATHHRRQFIEVEKVEKKVFKNSSFGANNF